MNGVTVEIGGRRGSRLATVSVQGLDQGKPVMIDVGVLVERPAGAWEIRAYEGGAGNGFAAGLRFTDFLTAVECVAKS